ncbi:hypothetical protein F3Y22_tig00111993pilonHSYRG00122 [Hibiscus syriacus]|uniref:Uncharacterized protein n=1 Tax=Hibiscus syriacus TaxID=106335 RepID=A0A6A2YCY2_HIBSY|nr:hypothetical protein F3Y22_tig00111993pilonHSYRG00122 [Hibiscus syriacus]
MRDEQMWQWSPLGSWPSTRQDQAVVGRGPVKSAVAGRGSAESVVSERGLLKADVSSRVTGGRGRVKIGATGSKNIFFHFVLSQNTN